MFRATFDLEVYPDEWKKVLTLALRKVGKSNYTSTNTYRPIALLTTICKIFSVCVTEDLSWASEKSEMLSPNHYGGRPGRTVTHLILRLDKFVKDNWRCSRVVFILFLDVKGAYPHMYPPRLAHNMRKRGVPKKIIDWMIQNMNGRSTTISFDDHILESYEVTNGAEQGGPDSQLFYEYYNFDLMDVTDPSNNELSCGFIDDRMIAAGAATFAESNKKIVNMIMKPKGALRWGRMHYSEFDIGKFGLVLALLDNRKVREPIVIEGLTI